ncbi:hypothetical protein EON65_44490 [archaeon]|nr:MAG: hypothetical protein EON65_44490 [archaeon]
MDATAHTPPSTFEVEGYPTLYFIPANTKKPVMYEGPREARGIVEFMKEHRTTKVGEL